MDIELGRILTAGYWQASLGTFFSLLIMVGYPSLAVTAIIKYGRKASPVLIFAVAHFIFAMFAPLPSIVALAAHEPFPTIDLLRATSSAFTIFALLYFETFYHNGRASVTQSFLNVVVSHRKAHMAKWQVLRIFGYCLVSLGVLLGAYTVLLFETQKGSMAWLPFMVYFLSTLNSGLFFAVRAERRMTEHDLKHQKGG